MARKKCSYSKVGSGIYLVKSGKKTFFRKGKRAAKKLCKRLRAR